MAEFPALPLWTDAYLADTRHLSQAEHGAYMLLLMTAWRSPDCSLPDDDEMLARYACCDRRTWARQKPVIMAMWTLENGRWRQKRLQQEREFLASRRSKLVEAGRRGANVRDANKALKNNETDEARLKRCLSPEEAPTPTTSTLLSDDKRVTQHDDADLQAASDAWNELAAEAGLPAMQVLTKPRRTKLRARLTECGGLDGWAYALGKVRDSPFLRGQNKTGWKADFDFLLQQKSFTKLMEGAYDRAKQTDGWGEVLRNAEDFHMA